MTDREIRMGNLRMGLLADIREYNSACAQLTTDVRAGNVPWAVKFYRESDLDADLRELIATHTYYVSQGGDPLL